MPGKNDNFPLDGAKWPVLVLDIAGNVVHANAAAIKQLSRDGQNIGNLEELWTSDNGCSAGEFIKRIATAPITTFPLRLKTKVKGERKTFSAHICKLTEGDRKLMLLQFFARKLSSTGTTNFMTRGDVGETPTEPLEEDSKVLPAGTIEQGLSPDDSVILPLSAAPAVPPPEQPNLSTNEQHKLMCALQLTRTVAMDFNNALTSILGHTSLLLNKVGADDSNRHSLEQIERSVERAAQVAFDLAAFSRDEKDMFPAAAGNLNKMIRRLVDHYKMKTPSDVEWRTSLDTKLSSATFAEPKLQQAIEKVLDNAIEAVGNEGTVSITTQNRNFEEETYDGYTKIVAGSYICLEINDSGPGIPEDMMSKVMDPFVTSKEGHRGLGLAWAYGLISNFSGCLVIASEAGQGTTVRVFLPATDSAAEELFDSEEELMGDQTILIVDDEELLRTMGDMVLSSFGYHVLTADNGRKALDLLAEEDNKDVDLVVTDLVMPHMDGYQLIESLKREKPDLRIICTSGNFRPTNAELGITYLQKPFDSMDLARAVKKVLSDN
jgi:nitrogen-specific signal transduction histidine kinase